MRLLGEGEYDEELLATLVTCNQRAADDNLNASSAAVAHVAVCGGSFESAVAAALMTLGAKHAPIAEARTVIFGTLAKEMAAKLLERGEKLPGWGNSFYKTGIDPAFEPLDRLLRDTYPHPISKLDEITEVVFKAKGRVLYPNAAAYTAVCAEILDVPRGAESILFLIGRLPIWSRQWVEACA